jgi:hypothetical protein
MTNNWKNLQLEIFYIYFFDQKLQFTYPQASLKDAQTTGESFYPQKRTSSTSKHENSFQIFLFLWVIFALLDPDPATQINADPCGSGSTTLLTVSRFSWLNIF